MAAKIKMPPGVAKSRFLTFCYVNRGSVSDANALIRIVFMQKRNGWVTAVPLVCYRVVNRRPGRSVRLAAQERRNLQLIVLADRALGRNESAMIVELAATRRVELGVRSRKAT